MRRLLIMLMIVGFMASCTTVQQVIENKEVYCSQFYKSVRAVGRSALSVTTGVVVPDVCDTIDLIIEEDESEDSDGGIDGSNSSNI